MDLVRAKQAWGISRREQTQGAGILVGHPDTGFTRHPEIFSDEEDAQRLVPGESFIDDSDAEEDLKRRKIIESYGHGTKTASVIMSSVGEQDPTTEGHVTGTAPKARLMPLKVTEFVGMLSTRRLRQAIKYATDSGCHVISMSLGSPFPSIFTHRAIRRAVDKGLIVIAAAGNQVRFVTYPARYDEVLAVAACDFDSKPWKGSCRGKDVDVTAPGKDVWKAEPERDGGFPVTRGNGTSYATATTAGVAALWLAHHGRKRLIDRFGERGMVAKFHELLKSTARRVDALDPRDFGAGVVDAEALLRAPLGAAPHGRSVRRLRPAKADVAVGPDVQIAKLVPGIPRTTVRIALTELLGVSELDLDDTLKEVGDELVFHLSTSRRLRNAFERGILRMKRPAAATPPPRTDPLAGARDALAELGLGPRR